MVSGRQAEAVQFIRDNTGLALSACACSIVPAKIDEGSDRAFQWHRETLMKKMRGSDFRGRKCVIGLNSADLFLQNYVIPRKQKMSVATQIQERLFNDCGDSVKTSIARHLVVPERFIRQRGGESLIIASVILVPGTIMEQYVNLATELRMVPQAMYGVSHAVANGHLTLLKMDESTDVQDQLFVSVDMGKEGTSISVVLQGEIVMSRMLHYVAPESVNAILSLDHEEPAVESDTTTEVHRPVEAPLDEDAKQTEAFREAVAGYVHEIRVCMHYIRSRLTQNRIDWVILSGHYTQFRQFCMTVAQELGLPTRISDPLQTLRVLPSVDTDELSMASDNLTGTIGLAMSMQERGDA